MNKIRIGSAEISRTAQSAGQRKIKVTTNDSKVSVIREPYNTDAQHFSHGVCDLPALADNVAVDHVAMPSRVITTKWLLSFDLPISNREWSVEFTAMRSAYGERDQTYTSLVNGLGDKKIQKSLKVTLDTQDDHNAVLTISTTLDEPIVVRFVKMCVLRR